MGFTNISGKFKSSVSFATSDVNDDDLNAEKLIPTVPEITDGEDVLPVTSTGKVELIDEVKRLFGQLWWLWLVVAFVYITKGE